MQTVIADSGQVPSSARLSMVFPTGYPVSIKNNLFVRKTENLVKIFIARGAFSALKICLIVYSFMLLILSFVQYLFIESPLYPRFGAVPFPKGWRTRQMRLTVKVMGEAK